MRVVSTRQDAQWHVGVAISDDTSRLGMQLLYVDFKSATFSSYDNTRSAAWDLLRYRCPFLYKIGS